MPTTPTSDRAATWSRYWASGALHSCAGSYGQTYEGPIAAFWQQGFAALPRDARVLDIATGNGPLPRLLLATPNRGDLRCEAVDLAQIAPPWLAQLPAGERARLNFRGGCAAEKLPFEAASFDLVISQWGLEYSTLPLSVPELLRVLKPGGQLRLVLHHQQGLPVRQARDELDHLQWLLAAEGFVDTAEAMQAPIAQAATPAGRQRLQQDAGANALRERFNDWQDRLSSRARTAATPEVLAEVRDACNQLLGLAMQQGLDAARQASAQLRARLADSRLQLQELCDHALDEAAARQLGTQLAGPAGQFQLQTLSDRQQLMGWTLVVER